MSRDCRDISCAVQPNRPGKPPCSSSRCRDCYLSVVLQVGDKAPEFKLPTTSGQELTLADALAKHRSLIFLFYVLDFTGG